MSRKQLIIDYRTVFESESGRRVLADLTKRCPLLTDSVRAEHGIDVNKLIYKEGQRSVMVHIYKMLHSDPYAQRPGKAIQGE